MGSASSPSPPPGGLGCGHGRAPSSQIASPRSPLRRAQPCPRGRWSTGELVVFAGTRLSFSLLRQRMTRKPTQVQRLSAAHPASFVAFDLLAADGTDLRPLPFTGRRQALEQVASWAPPLQLSPTTTDPEVARAWMRDYRPAGLEGVVVKAAAGAYRPGARDWLKVKSRTTHEVILGAITGTVHHPQTVIAGLHRHGELVVVVRTVPLTTGVLCKSADRAPPHRGPRPGRPRPGRAEQGLAFQPDGHRDQPQHGVGVGLVRGGREALRPPPQIPHRPPLSRRG